MESYQQFRAPAADNGVLVDPAWNDLLARLREPRSVPSLRVGGVALTQLATTARAELIAAATRYTGAYADVPAVADGPLIVSGHQPELFHPGVWFKNFALDALARASGGVGIHLLIDSDLSRAPSIRLPTGSIDSPRVVSIDYDATTAAKPHEERTIIDADRFTSFASRVTETLRPLVDDPLVSELWRHANAARGRSDNLGVVLSEARHRLEIDAGSRTLELPASVIGDTEGFRRLAAELLVRPEETREAYNAALDDYRTAHHLRNAAQPLPDLAGDADGVETPLWVWSGDDPTRRALYAQRRGDNLLLTDRAGWRAEGPTDEDGVVAWIGELREQGVKLRSRALITTLYARLVLADLFLHGIGGAKYDQVTDRFAERFLGAAPPSHATLTATLRLPIAHDSATETDRRDALREQRDLRYHPERFVTDAPAKEIVEAAAVKSRWIATDKTPENAAQRHAAIVASNRLIARSLQAELRSNDRRLATIERELRGAAILDSREYSFCLFPADDVRRRLQRLSRVESIDA